MVINLDFLDKNGVVRLTGNDRRTLRMLLEDSRTSDVDIGKKLRISSQAAAKIRNKLKSRGVIKCYSLELNYFSLGVHVYALSEIRVLSFNNSHSEIMDFLSSHLINLYKVYKNNVSYIGIFGFKNIKEMHDFFNKLNFEYPEIIRVDKTHIFHVDGFLKHTQTDLYNKIIKEFGREVMPKPPDITHDPPTDGKGALCKLSDNEKGVLKALVNDSRISLRELSKNLGSLKLSDKGIGKIKERLENKGVIKKYTVCVNPESLGIKTFAFVFLKKKPLFLRFKNGLSDWILKAHNVIGSYRMEGNSLHTLLCGFRDLNELDGYCNHLEAKNKDLIEVHKIDIVSKECVSKPMIKFHHKIIS